jgi:hypothetical protein
MPWAAQGLGTMRHDIEHTAMSRPAWRELLRRGGMACRSRAGFRHFVCRHRAHDRAQ